jgi:uncharacterized membrane protein
MAEQNTASLPNRISRLFAPDALRGLIMVFMALDHANHFVAHKHPPGEMWGGPFPVYFDSLTFLTRLVTHFSAPGFFFLMGMGMALLAHSYLKKGWSKGALTRHLAIRGAVLIAIKLLLVNRAWEFSPGGWGIQVYIGVLFALGANMILGSLLLWLKPAHLLGLTALLALATEWAVPDPSAWGPGMGLLRYVFLIPGGIVGPAGQTLLWSYYPVLPWLELVTLGMVFGYWFGEDRRMALDRAAKFGLALLAAFVVVRYLDGFGNIRPRTGNTWIDWLNPVKYPPSIAFTAMTMGVNLLLLSALGRLGESAQRWLRPLTVLGRAPLLFYVLHLFLYLAMGRLFAPQGTSIPAMIPFWLLGLLILLPVCAWYGSFKQRQPAGSVLRYL